jgi:long-subunit acyl-CoA synthetase (AMP-forming)
LKKQNFNSKKIENLKIKSVFVLDGSYGSYIPFERLLEEGKNQLLDKIPHFNVDPKNDYFLLVWSSGTTGLPKTTITSHYSFVASLTDFWTTKQFDPLIV